eukprot:SAG31_NODE_4094_length_3597_cov_3.474557_4_plen_79_part_00
MMKKLLATANLATLALAVPQTAPTNMNGTPPRPHTTRTLTLSCYWPHVALAQSQQFRPPFPHAPLSRYHMDIASLPWR